jgi:hypothetical protein
MTEPPLRVAIWCAVSSPAQAAADKTSLDDQEAAGRAFAAALGAVVVAVHRVAHTRDLILWTDAEAAIPAYRHLREDLAAGRLDLLWALDIDRLGREPALQQQVIALAERQAGAEVYLSTNPHPVGQKGIGHRYIESIQGVRAAEDQSLRVYRHGRGMTSRVLKRGFIANNCPLGYAPLRDPTTGKVGAYQFTPEIAVVDLCTDLFLAGHSYAEIRRRLDAAYPPPPGRDRWAYKTVTGILRNDTYAGLPSWSGQRPEHPSPVIPARWDVHTFASIVRERQRRQRAPYARPGSGPLTGVAFCQRCGAPMTRFRARRRYYLRCSTQSHKALTGRPCHPNNLPESAALEALAARLSELATPAALDQAVAHLQDDAQADRLRADHARAEAARADLCTQRERLALALAAGKMQPDIYAAADAHLLAHLRAESARLQDLGAALSSLPDLQQKREALASLTSAFHQIAPTLDPAELSHLLQAAGVRIECAAGRVLSVSP